MWLSCWKDVGMFPDAVSARALKHLQSLTSMVEMGHRAILFSRNTLELIQSSLLRI